MQSKESNRDESPNGLLVRYLIHCYLYYELHATFLTDGEFDELAHRLRDCWSEVTHRHKDLIDYEYLKKSTSGYYLSGKYPAIVKGCAEKVLKKEMQP